MPVVKIDMWEGRDKAMKRLLIQAVSKTVAETLAIPVDRIHIIITDVPKHNWGIKGEQASELR